MDNEYNQARHTEVSSTTEPMRRAKKRRWVIVSVIIVIKLFIVASTAILLHTLNQPPAAFPTDHAITIAPGTSVRDIAATLADHNVVQSESFTYYSIILFHEPTEIKASTYVFNEPVSTQAVVQLLTEGDFDNDLLTLTLVEGERVRSYAETAARVLPHFSTSTFISLAEKYEGRLFPDTYFIPADFSESALLRLLQDTFAEQVSPLFVTASTTLSTDEVLILASIVEREANSPESMRMVAGIFLNRLAIGMPLQADASIEYVVETPLGELPAGQLATELRERKNPYNTYLNQGLPPTPIGNPGLEAITAVLEPTPSDYFYYITGTDGEFYYAETLREHNANIAAHLR